MNSVFIKPTKQRPKVDFNKNGSLLLEGRCLPEDAISFFQPLIDFATVLESNYVVFDINLEYFNTASSKKILDLLRHLDANNKIEQIKVNWHYEEGDDDSAEIAEIFEEECIMRTFFQYFEHDEDIAVEDRVNPSN